MKRILITVIAVAVGIVLSGPAIASECLFVSPDGTANVLVIGSDSDQTWAVSSIRTRLVDMGYKTIAITDMSEAGIIIDTSFNKKYLMVVKTDCLKDGSLIVQSGRFENIETAMKFFKKIVRTNFVATEEVPVTSEHPNQGTTVPVTSEHPNQG